MKELYISPELEILCFLPMEGIASNPVWQQTRGANSGLSYGDHLDTDQDENVDNRDQDGSL